MAFLARLFGKHIDDGLSLLSKTVTTGKTGTLINTVSKYGSEVVTKTSVKVLTWGNAAKVALVAGFGYIFLTGGLSSTVASTLGISEESAQYLVWAVALIVALYCIRKAMTYFRFRVFSRRRRYNRGYGGYNRRRY